MYKIRLPNFEGPFDLLLYFIKRDELNIYDIPIARITEEFLHYIRLMQYFDLELAGEFVLMASTLMYIKTQMLLPRVETDDDEDIEDPRTQLVQRLIEYRQFKDASGHLSELAENQRYTFYRGFFDQDNAEDENKNYYKNTTLFDLLKAFKIALERAKKEPKQHVVNMFPVTVSEKKEFIIERINKKKRIAFFELIEGTTRPHIIVTFLAILELIKSKFIIISQSDVFGDIMISKRPEFNLN